MDSHSDAQFPWIVALPLIRSMQASATGTGDDVGVGVAAPGDDVAVGMGVAAVGSPASNTAILLVNALIASSSVATSASSALSLFRTSSGTLGTMDVAVAVGAVVGVGVGSGVGEDVAVGVASVDAARVTVTV